MARAVSCGHCGESHGSIAEVRQCSLGDAQAATETAEHSLSQPRSASSSPSSPRSSGSNPSSSRLVSSRPNNFQSTSSRSADPRLNNSQPNGFDPLMCDATELAGPQALGRSLLIGPDQTIPTAWQDCEQVKANASADTAVTERLYQAWQKRERLVILWEGPLPDPEPSYAGTRKPFYELEVDEELPGERLAFAISANTVNALEPKPSFAPLQTALTLGARLNVGDTADKGEGKTSDKGEMITPDQNNAWADGGPLDLRLTKPDDKKSVSSLNGCAIIPRINLMAKSLRPLQPHQQPTAELAQDQLEAVAHASGPARILAPAGSGKTRVLTERARYLAKGCGVDAKAISLVAYNRRAKNEMRSRLNDVAALDIRTLNSLALAISTGTGPFRSGRSGSTPSTITELDVRRMLDKIVPGRRRKKLSDPLEPWIDALSACRLGLRDPHEIEQAYGGDVAGFSDVLASYRRQLERSNALDFDEQILRAIELLLNDVSVRRTARSVAPMLLVDEFQDLTPAHLLLIRLIAGPAAEVFAVGDDDQTIYGYTGASPDWLIDFEKFFAGSADHHLTVNYRCPTKVVAAASNLLTYNRRRVAKTINAGPNARQDADGLKLFNKGDPQDNLVAQVSSHLEAGASPNDIAVLARVNAALMPAAVYLHTAGVAVVRPAGLSPDTLDRSGLGAALSWLRLATTTSGFNQDDVRLALKRPPRSLHPRVADWACEQQSLRDFRALARRLNTERETDTVAAFADDIEKLQNLYSKGATTEKLLNEINNTIGLLGAASQLDRSQRTARRAAHADELAALSAVARLQPKPNLFESWLRGELGALPTAAPDSPANGITLATIHTTKGLEWPHVIVHDVRDGLFPHSLAEDIEEERRIFHVGLTRGQQSVAITASGPPSPFVKELLEPREADLPWPEDSLAKKGAANSKAKLGSSSQSARTASSKTKGSKTSGSKTQSSKPAKRDRPDAETPLEAKIRDELTKWRRERCKEDSVPAYVVLGNQTLDAIAVVRPESLAALGDISGIGPAKIERYGADILGIVAAAQD